MTRSTRWAARASALGLALTLGLGCSGLPGIATPAGATPAPKVARPTVEGPVTGGKGAPTLIGPGTDLLAAHDYVAEEYFFGGTATAYDATKPLTADGRWPVAAGDTAPYRVRMVVYRPENAADFNGTVYVEWLNVTAGFETSAVYSLVHNEVMREGAAWIGVSAQAGGVQGTDTIIDTAGAPTGGLRVSDPARYDTLTHPGDRYSFDIFSQAGAAARGDAAGARPLGDLRPKRVIAVGKSQSAYRLVSYVDAVHPIAGVYDGFLIVSRHRTGAPFGPTGFGLPDDTVPATARIRTDTDVPVLVMQTESDLIGIFGAARARQHDSKLYRLWEVAGTAHADTYAGAVGFGDTGNGAAELAILDPRNATGGPLGCAAPVNSGPAFAVQSAALRHLDAWVRDGVAPPRAPRIRTTGGANPTIVRDEHGNAEGGIRTPLVDAPIAALTGEANAGSSLCFLFGRTTPFDAATLASLYPTHSDYVRRFDTAATRTTKAGFWLDPEAEHFKAAARQLSVGG